MDPRDFRESVLACRNRLDEEEPELWPHNLILAQWVALVRAQGSVEEAIRDSYHSLFIRGLSAFEPVKTMFTKVDTWQYTFGALFRKVDDLNLGKMIAYHPWRPERTPKLFQAHTIIGTFIDCLDDGGDNGTGIDFPKDSAEMTTASNTPTRDE